MIETEEQRIALAASAGEEEIARFVHDPSLRVIRALLANPALTDENLLVIVERKNLPSGILEQIAKEKRWSGTYAIQLALAKNPKTPLFVSLSLIRHIRIFDLEDLARNRLIPLAFRRKVEALIVERIPTMPAGIKKTLAKKALGSVLQKLLVDEDPEVVRFCLGNPHLQEAQLFKVVSHAETRAETIRQIAEHPSWSCRALLRYSLVRNAHTPLARSVTFLRGMTINELRDLVADTALPVTIRPFVLRALRARDEEPAAASGERVFEVNEDDDVGMEEFGVTDEETSADDVAEGEAGQAADTDRTEET